MDNTVDKAIFVQYNHLFMDLLCLRTSLEGSIMISQTAAWRNIITLLICKNSNNLSSLVK